MMEHKEDEDDDDDGENKIAVQVDGMCPRFCILRIRIIHTTTEHNRRNYGVKDRDRGGGGDYQQQILSKIRMQPIICFRFVFYRLHILYI